MLMSKHNYRLMVTDKCREKDKVRLIESSVRKEIFYKILKEEYERKIYMKEQNVKEVRQFFYTCVRI